MFQGIGREIIRTIYIWRMGYHERRMETANRIEQHHLGRIQELLQQIPPSTINVKEPTHG